MTMYSVWSYRDQRYDYYQAPGDGATHAGAPTIRSNSDIGAIPEGAAWRVPSGAMKVGSGELPQGRIASMGEFTPTGSNVNLAIAAVAAYFAWKWWIR